MDKRLSLVAIRPFNPSCEHLTFLLNQQKRFAANSVPKFIHNH